uniref:Uncharacterized protein n=1 Tax=Chenopodium quinoa TaxID=63459 RepID=A0A803MZD6_CHEQI
MEGKIESGAMALARWASLTFGNVRKRIKKAEKKLRQLQNQRSDANVLARFKSGYWLARLGKTQAWHTLQGNQDEGLWKLSEYRGLHADTLSSSFSDRLMNERLHQGPVSDPIQVDANFSRLMADYHEYAKRVFKHAGTSVRWEQACSEEQSPLQTWEKIIFFSSEERESSFKEHPLHMEERESRLLERPLLIFSQHSASLFKNITL